MFVIEGPLSFWWWMVDDREVVEPAGGLERADVVAWGCGLCLGHSPPAAAVVVVAVADIVVGRDGIAAVVAVAAATVVASTVVVVASDPLPDLQKNIRAPPDLGIAAEISLEQFGNPRLPRGAMSRTIPKPDHPGIF
ncbi:hypothetical protein Taro_019061 [Colocasia esculenta]|uniref:Uncharacterized protein n=1 Tax=Colocasia esculenta TaxID=4460 RepID=A0A843V108_COLES|nr:hypothetical protein [Colocasia esculenta]